MSAEVGGVRTRGDPVRSELANADLAEIRVRSPVANN